MPYLKIESLEFDGRAVKAVFGSEVNGKSAKSEWALDQKPSDNIRAFERWFLTVAHRADVDLHNKIHNESWLVHFPHRAAKDEYAMLNEAKARFYALWAPAYEGCA